MGRNVVRTAGVLGIIWNLVGVASYLGVMGPEATDMPAWVTAAFAVAVWGGLAGSIGLVLLQRWAAPVLWASFVGAVIDWGWVFISDAAVDPSVPLGVAVIVIALALALVASRARRTATRAA